MQKKITQTSGANSEHRHSEIERFSMLNKWSQSHISSKLKTQKTDSVIVSKSSVTPTDQSL